MHSLVKDHFSASFSNILRTQRNPLCALWSIALGGGLWSGRDVDSGKYSDTIDSEELMGKKIEIDLPELSAA